VGDIRLEEVPDPRIQEPTDAVVRLTASAICGTDLHMIRGTVAGMKPGTILGHEGVGIVEELGSDVRNLAVGDRVVIPSTLCCGYCAYCRAGYTAQCDNANPNGPAAGTAFFGGPAASGPFDGMQAEKVRVPFASANLVKLPDSITDEQAILLSDVFPTGYFGADIAEIEPGNTVAVFGCGPVGQMAIASAKLMGAGRVFAVDCIPSRLAMARAQGAEVIDYEQENPVEALRRMTGGIGVDRAIDAVGVDANHAHQGPAAAEAKALEKIFQQEVEQVAPEANPQGDNWHPGNAPSQTLFWAVEALCKAGTLSIIGVYPETVQLFPIGAAMMKNLTLQMGNCNHRKYLPIVIELVRTGAIDPSTVLTQKRSLRTVIEAFQEFDKRSSDWIKVELTPAST
jgi:threonine dehydrogenase-like Zn-dependent dehydrogenase